MQQGDLVWFDSGLGFLSPGVVMQMKKNPFTVLILNEDTNERIQLPGRTVLSARDQLPSPYGADDMVHLKDLHSGSILQNVMFRFELGQIYTYIGSILLSVNPYRLIKDLYGNRAIERYRDKILGNQPPHLYAIANEAFTNACTKTEDQVIVVSGESGAGKTESTKLVLQYLTSVSSQGKFSKGKLISDQLLESSPLLESFGNAKTLRNDNSSRFGKFMEIKISEKTIIAAQMSEYLLEKSRIVYQAPEERNYHVFYEMLNGMSENQKAKYGLSTARYFYYLNQGRGSLTCASKNDFDDFQRLTSAMDVLSISTTEQDGIFAILAAVLHLGNINFVPMGDDDQASVKDESSVHQVASLLKVKPSDLVDDITFRITETREEKIYSSLSVEEAVQARDGIAKALYAHLFKWLVQKVNKLVGKTVPSSTALNLLDIFGFEDLPKNSFEQLCINYANESLQQVFIRSVFKAEQTEYQRERIDWHGLDYNDNADVIDLLSKKHSGIIHILDDQSHFPQATDHSFLDKVVQAHVSHPAFKVDKLRDLQFCVRHYAGEVSYSSHGFLEKNRDRLRFETLCLLADSGHPLVCELFAELHSLELDRTLGPRAGGDVSKLLSTAAGGSKGVPAPSKSYTGMMKRKAPTVAAKFHASLANLIATITRCNPLFVRCIKPNSIKSYVDFDRQLVVAQLNYLGVLETITIRKLGFPVRLYFAAFLSRYRCLMLHMYKAQWASVRTLQSREVCELFLKSVPSKYQQDFQLGITKVFLREQLERHLEQERSSVMWVAAAKLQSWAKAILLRKRFLQKRQAAVVLQKNIRQYIAKQRYLRYKWAVTRMQAYRRGKQTREEYLTLRSRHRLMKHQVALMALEASIQQSNDVYLARVGNTKQNVVYVVPEDLAHILSQNLSWAEIRDESVVRIERGKVALKKQALELPERIDSFALSKYTMIALRGDLIWGECREAISVPFHNNVHEAHFELARSINKTLLYALYEEDLQWEHLKVVCAYIIKTVQSEPLLKDETYIQLCSQTWRLKSTKHQERAWLLMASFLDTFTPSPQFATYLLKYISDWAFEPYRAICQHKLLKSSNFIYGALTRNTPVCWLEWLANDKQMGMALELFLMDSTSHVTQVDSWDTCEEVVVHLMNHLSLPRENWYGWSLSMERMGDGGLEMYAFDSGEPQKTIEELPGYTFVFDSIAELEYTSEFVKQRQLFGDAWGTTSNSPTEMNAPPHKDYSYSVDSNDFPIPDYMGANSPQSVSTTHQINIRGLTSSDQKEQASRSSTDEHEDLVKVLMMSIKGEESKDSTESLKRTEMSDNVSPTRGKKPAPKPPGQTGGNGVSQSIKVLSQAHNKGAFNDWVDLQQSNDDAKYVHKADTKSSVKAIKENRAGHVLKVADVFTSQGVVLSGRGLGDYIDKREQQRLAAELSASQREQRKQKKELGERALAVQRLMHERAAIVRSEGDLHQSARMVLDEMKYKRHSNGVFEDEETTGLFADTETGFSSFTPLPPPPPQFNGSSDQHHNGSTSNQRSPAALPLSPPNGRANSDDTLFSQTKVAPPVAFSGGTKTISENRKSLFTKDLAAQESEKTHQEAISLLKRSSFLKQEKESKPVRRESSKRPARSASEFIQEARYASALESGERALSPVFDNRSPLQSTNVSPWEAVRKEQELGEDATDSNMTEVKISKRSSPQEGYDRSTEIQRDFKPSAIKLKLESHQTAAALNKKNKEKPVEAGKVSSAVKRLDSVLSGTANPVVTKPEVTQFKTTYAENYKENIALTVRRFVVEERGKTELYPVKRTPFFKYDKVNWKFFVRKEMFSPTERVSNHQMKTLLFHQIVSDVYSSSSRKLQSGEQSEMVRYLTSNGVRNFKQTGHVSEDVRDWVIAKAKTWKLYFSRLYPVVAIKDSVRVKHGFLNFTHIAVCHSGLKLVSVQEPDRGLKVVMEIFYPNISSVQFTHKSLKLDIRASLDNQQSVTSVVSFTEQGSFIKKLIEKYRQELESSTVALVRAHDEHLSGVFGELQFRRGDVIRVLDECALQPVMLGELKGVTGQVLKAKVNSYRAGSVVEPFYEDAVVIARNSQLESQTAMSTVSEDHHERDSVLSIADSDSGISSHATGDIPKLSMLEFATIYFREEKERKGRREQEQELLNRLWRRLVYSRHPLKKSLLKPAAVSDNLYAVKAFSFMLRFAGEVHQSSRKADYNLVYDILKIGKISVDLVDEIYCQLVKQTTRKASDKKEGYFQYWRLFALFASYYQCSNKLKPYLFRYLNKSPQNSPHPVAMAKLVCENLSKTFKYGGRRELPGVSEIRAFCEHRTSKRQCFILPGKSVTNIKVFTATLVSEAITLLAAQLGIQSGQLSQQFGIATIAPSEGYLSPLSETSYLMDTITAAEVSNSDYKLAFLRLFWTIPIEKFTVKAINVCFSQILTSFYNGFLTPANAAKPMSDELSDLISKLMALDFRIVDPDIKAADINEEQLKAKAPEFLKAYWKAGGNVHIKQWANQVSRHLTVVTKLSEEESKTLFLRSVSNRPLFGAAVYPGTVNSQRPVAFVCVTKTEIVALNSNKSLLEAIKLESISQIKVNNVDKPEYVYVKYGDFVKPSIAHLYTKYAKEIVNFVLGYQFRLGLSLKTV